MQVTSLYRRGVVLPLNAEAEESLRHNDIEDSTLIRCVGIKDQSLFDQLWESGLFQAINTRTGSLIDDYEEEFIEFDSIGNILDSIEEVKSKKGIQSSGVNSFLVELSELAIEARNLGRPVLFVL